MAELYPRLLQLAGSRCRYDIGLNIDAEEADRLELSLDLLERLCFEPALAGWNGIGFVIQAYQKRCPAVVDWLIDLARRSERRLMVRLVKGAYWDGEIKRAQLDGAGRLPGLHAQGLHRRRLPRLREEAARRAGARSIRSSRPTTRTRWPPIHALAGPRLRRRAVRVPVPARHGRAALRAGRRLTSEGKLGRPCRIYAPVGTHDTLLAYLVRRLLENGANTSFVNRIAERRGAARGAGARTRCDTVEELAAQEGARRPAASGDRPAARPVRRGPRQLARPRSRRRDRSCARSRRRSPHAAAPGRREPLLGVDAVGDEPAGAQPGRSRATSSARCRDATPDDVQAALRRSRRRVGRHGPRPRRRQRARCLKAAADRLEADTAASGDAARARSRQDLRQRRRRGARGGRLPCATTRTRCAAISTTPLIARSGRWSASARGISARDLHRPGRGGARRRQPGARQAGRADAAGRRRGGARAARGRRAVARVLQLLPGRGETVGAALVGDPRVAGRALHRLDRGRARCCRTTSPAASARTAGRCR